EVVEMLPELRIDEGGAVGDAFGRGFVMIENDEVDAHLAEEAGLVPRARAAVGGDEEIGGIAFEAVFDAFDAEAIALLKPGREEGARLEAEGPPDGVEQGDRGDAVDIVVAVEDDGLPAVDRFEDA